MITFDKMKIISNIENIRDLNMKHFTCNIKDGEVLYYKYQQEQPYTLIIEVDCQHNELSLEFTGKILLDKYIYLINRETIKDALLEINRLGICTIDIDKIFRDSYVAKCDVTKDVISKSHINDIAIFVKSNLTNYTKWDVTPDKNKGIVISNRLKTKRHKKRLSIYDKGNEIRKVSNENFLSLLKNKENLLSYFDNKIRFELNITTKAGIRSLLEIPDTKLYSVLNATANPILSVLDEAVKSEVSTYKYQTLRDCERASLLKECNYDLEKVEVIVRSISSKNTSIKRLMQPYKDLFKQMQASTNNQINLKELVA